jgi:hypothetical protein
MLNRHAARNLTVFNIVIEINQVTLKISSGMPIKHVNTLAAR